MSRKNAEPKTGPTLAVAAERTGVLIRGLQARLSDQPAEESTEDLERELQKYFAARAIQDRPNRFPFHQIRQRVVDGVADKILAGWDGSPEGKTAALEDEVVARLIERILECLLSARGELVRTGGSSNSGKMPGAPLAPTLPA